MAAGGGSKLLIVIYVIALLVINLPSECDGRPNIPLIYHWGHTNFNNLGISACYPAANVLPKTEIKLSYLHISTVLKCTKHGAICLSLPANLFVIDLTIHSDVSLNPGPNAEASKTQTDHTSGSNYVSSIINTLPWLKYSKSKLYFLKNFWSLSPESA